MFPHVARFGLTALAVSWSSLAFTGTVDGQVVGVTDGDTITVLDGKRTQHKVRLGGIDAPEKAQAFGKRSKEHLSSLVYGKQVTVETEKQDRYGRTVGKVLVGGRDTNLAMILAGFAWHYKKYEGEQSPSDRLLYAAAEQEAREAHRGLWHDQTVTAPWDYRAERRIGREKQ